MITALLLLAGAPADPVPEDEDVVAGWLGAVVFVALILAVAVLARSLVVHLRRAQAAKDAGVYGDDPEPKP